MMKTLRVALDLAKVRICLLATVTCAAGYILAADRMGWNLLLAVSGIFLLACGSSALNQIQERDIDGRMERTKGRPLPSGRVRVGPALLFTAGLVVAGSALLYATGSPVALVLGLFALLWYNGVYTPLKRVTAFAVVPGALIGAIPPVAGWAAAGGDPTAPQILSLAFFLFVWQVPHFWLILLYLGNDYSKAGLPSMHDKFNPEQLARLTFIWMLAAVLACLAMPLFGMGRGVVVYFIMTISSVWLVWSAARLVVDREVSFRGTFRNINLYALAVLVGLSLNRFLPLG